MKLNVSDIYSNKKEEITIKFSEIKDNKLTYCTLLSLLRLEDDFIYINIEHELCSCRLYTSDHFINMSIFRDYEFNDIVLDIMVCSY